MKITREFIQTNKSKRGGWTFSQIAMLGESWPPKSGWIERAIGREISETDAIRFIEYGKQRQSKKERRSLKLEIKSKKLAARNGDIGAMQRVINALAKSQEMRRLLNDDVNGDAFLESYEWRKVRMSVLKKYGSRCQCCGATPADGVKMHVDHIKPRKKFPELALDVNNLQVLCEVCNHGKGNWDQTDWRAVEAANDVLEMQHIRSIISEGK